MKVRFWGVRGSIPSPGMRTVKYGGNTACIEIRGDNDELLILDAGSGIRELGNSLLACDMLKKPLTIPLLLSHTHWDHIQGFPFFAPLYIPTTKVTIYGPGQILGQDLSTIFEGQMMHCYFPVHIKQLKAQLKFMGLDQQELKIGPFHVTTLYLNHPLPVLGYRIKYNEKVFVSLFDHEYYLNPYTTPEYNLDQKHISQVGDKAIRKVSEYLDSRNQKIINFAQHADLIVHDSQYLRKEYQEGKIGWGHSYIEYVLTVMKQAKVRRLALFHHDPMRADVELHRLENVYLKQIYVSTSGSFAVFFARERLQIEL